MNTFNDIKWEKVKMVIFDVDGTLYDQNGMRRKMLQKLLLHYGLRPWFAKHLKVIQSFRLQREEHAGEQVEGIDKQQYVWCQNQTGVSAAKVESIVTKWMHDIPLNYIKQFRYAGVQEFMHALYERRVIRAIYSDYPFEQKLNALDLSYEYGVASTEPSVESLKPNPRGLNHLMKQADLSALDCVFIGDRQDRDGDCAIRAGMPYLIVDPKQPDYFNKLTKTFRERNK